MGLAMYISYLFLFVRLFYDKYTIMGSTVQWAAVKSAGLLYKT